MDVLFFTTAYDPQMEVQVVHREFLQRLQERGCRVSILTSLPGRARAAGWIWEEAAGLPICRYALRGRPFDEALNLFSRRLLHYDGFLTILRRYLAYFRSYPWPDLVHVESAYPLGAVAALARRAVPLPYVINVRGADLFNEPGARFGYARYPIVRALLRRAFRFAAASRATTPQTEQIIRAYGAPVERVRMIPRNIRDECFPEDVGRLRAESRAEIEASYSIPPGTQILIAAGRLLPVKGFDILLRALAQAQGNLPEWRLFLCGATRHDPVVGDYLLYLRRLADGLGLGSRVIFTGELPATRFTRCLAASDAVVVPSLREGSNKVLMEGAALGLPFVATATTGAVDFFRDPPGGLIVPPGDPAALAEALTRLLGDKALQRQLGEQAARVAGRFRSAQVAEEMLALYHEVLAPA
ncbi:MAG: glycosyltransferase family 4 protein [Chloroflexia bacterium]